MFEKNIYKLISKFDYINSFSIGYSVLNVPLHTLKIGNGSKKIFICAGTHANEWITSLLLLKFIDDFCSSHINSFILENYTIYFLPVINPDGINLVTGYFPCQSFIYKKCHDISNKFPDIPFPNGWKANINAVDLNLQFPANWDVAKKTKYSLGFTCPAPRDFVGYAPLSEPESRALYNFSLRSNFDLILTFHSQGEVIYWKYDNFLPNNSYEIGKVLANYSGYSLDLTPLESSYAGYKDWFISCFNKPRIYY